MRRWGRKCQDSPSTESCISVPKIFVGQPFRLSLISVIEKIYASDGYVTISVDILCLTVAGIFVEEPSVLPYFRVLKKFMDKKGRRRKGVSQCFVENFLSHNAENFVGNPSVLCFRIFPEAKMFMDKKGEYQEFPSKVFCLTLLTNFVVEPFSVKIISGIKIVYV